MSREPFGGATRAQDGCIVTFRLPDLSIEVHHFASLVRTKGPKRKTSRDKSYIQQVIDWADAHQAKIISMSSPATILRDLQGTRAPQEVKRIGREGLYGPMMQRHLSDVVHFPEQAMLKARSDLFESPSRGSIDDRAQSIRHVRTRGVS